MAFFNQILWYLIAWVCLELPETILKSIIYVRNMIKAESVNVSLQRHLAALSESFDCLQ